MRIGTKERAEGAGRKKRRKMRDWFWFDKSFFFSRLFCFIQHREEHEHKMMQTDNFIRRAQVYHTKQLIDRFLRFSVHGRPSLLDPPIFIHENTFMSCLYFLLHLFILILIHSLIWSFLHSFLSFIQIIKFFHFLFTCIETFKKWRLFSSTFSSSLPLPSPFYFSNLPPTTYHQHNFLPFWLSFHSYYHGICSFSFSSSALSSYHHRFQSSLFSFFVCLPPTYSLIFSSSFSLLIINNFPFLFFSSFSSYCPFQLHPLLPLSSSSSSYNLMLQK